MAVFLLGDFFSSYFMTHNMNIILFIVNLCVHYFYYNDFVVVYHKYHNLFFLKKRGCQLNKNTLNTSFFLVTQLDTPNGSHKLSPRKGHLDKIPKWVTTGRTWYTKTFATRVSMDVIVNSLEVGLFHLFAGRLTAYFYRGCSPFAKYH